MPKSCQPRSSKQFETNPIRSEYKKALTKNKTEKPTFKVSDLYKNAAFIFLQSGPQAFHKEQTIYAIEKNLQENSNTKIDLSQKLEVARNKARQVENSDFPAVSLDEKGIITVNDKQFNAESFLVTMSSGHMLAMKLTQARYHNLFTNFIEESMVQRNESYYILLMLFYYLKVQYSKTFNSEDKWHMDMQYTAHYYINDIHSVLGEPLILNS